MRQFAAFLILVALFVVLVGSRFRASDGDRLLAVSRKAVAKVRDAMPPSLNLAASVDALRRELPTRPEDAVRARLAADRRLAGVEVTVVGEGATVRLRGVVPDDKKRKVALSLAENTAGVDQVVDELAVPEGERRGSD
jgi:hyperosmotically inducible protein